MLQGSPDIIEWRTPPRPASQGRVTNDASRPPVSMAQGAHASPRARRLLATQAPPTATPRAHAAESGARGVRLASAIGTPASPATPAGTATPRRARGAHCSRVRPATAPALGSQTTRFQHQQAMHRDAQSEVDGHLRRMGLGPRKRGCGVVEPAAGGLQAVTGGTPRQRQAELLRSLMSAAAGGATTATSASASPRGAPPSHRPPPRWASAAAVASRAPSSPPVSISVSTSVSTSVSPRCDRGLMSERGAISTVDTAVARRLRGLRPAEYAAHIGAAEHTPSPRPPNCGGWSGGVALDHQSSVHNSTRHVTDADRRAEPISPTASPPPPAHPDVQPASPHSPSPHSPSASPTARSPPAARVHGQTYGLSIALVLPLSQKPWVYGVDESLLARDAPRVAHKIHRNVSARMEDLQLNHDLHRSIHRVCAAQQRARSVADHADLLDQPSSATDGDASPRGGARHAPAGSADADGGALAAAAAAEEAFDDATEEDAAEAEVAAAAIAARQPLTPMQLLALARQPRQPFQTITDDERHSIGIAPTAAPPEWLPSGGAGQRELPVAVWSVRLSEAAAFLEACMQTDTWRALEHVKGPHAVTMRDVVDHFVIPWTSGTGSSIAARLSADSAASRVAAAGASASKADAVTIDAMLSPHGRCAAAATPNDEAAPRADGVLCHAWLSRATETYECIRRLMGSGLGRARVFFDVLCLYQADDGVARGMTIEEQIKMQPAQQLLASRPRLGLYLLHSSRVDVYGRGWVMHEVLTALDAGVLVRGVFDLREWTHTALLTHPPNGLPNDAARSCLTCRWQDKARLRALFAARGFEAVDATMLDVRTQLMSRDLRRTLEDGGSRFLAIPDKQAATATPAHASGELRAPAASH